MTAPSVAFDLSADFEVVEAVDYPPLGVVYAAQLLGRIEDRLTIGHFMVSVVPCEPVDPRTAALAIARILAAQREPDRAVKLVRLPCGPAVATEELRELAAFQLGQAQVFVKPPQCAGLVVLTMATPTACDLTRYTGELALVAQSLRFA